MQSSKSQVWASGLVLSGAMACAVAQTAIPAPTGAASAAAPTGAVLQARSVEEMLQADTKAALDKLRPPAPPAPLAHASNARTALPDVEIVVVALRGHGDVKTATLAAGVLTRNVKVGDTFVGFEVVRVGDGCVELSKPAPVAPVSTKSAAKAKARKPKGETALVQPAAQSRRTVCYVESSNGSGVGLASGGIDGSMGDARVQAGLHVPGAWRQGNQGLPIGTPLPTVPASILPLRPPSPQATAAPVSDLAPGNGAAAAPSRMTGRF